MAKTTLNELLFKCSPTTVITKDGAVTLGSCIPVAKAKCSAIRTGRMSSGPKISRIAEVFFRIVSGYYKVTGNPATKTVLLESKVGPVSYDAVAKTVFYDKENRSYTTALAARILSDIISAPPSLEEFLIALDECLTEYGADGSVSLKSLGYLCDTYYYGSKELTQEISIDVNENALRLYKQGKKTGTMRSDVFPSFLVPFIADAEATSSATTTEVSGDGSFLEECKSGKYEIGAEWSTESQARIQPIEYLDNFIPNRAFVTATKLAFKKLSAVTNRIADGADGLDAIKKDYLNIILVGKPGTGKTATANALSAALNLPLYVCPLSKNSEEDEAEGKTKISEGNFTFKETPFLSGYVNGGIMLMEEFNLADPAVMQGAFGQAIEPPFILMKDGVEPVRRHPLTIIISTMNTGTQGSKEPNEAFASRHPFVFAIEDPTENDFISILQSNTGATKANCKKVYKAYSAIQQYLSKSAGCEELCMSVSLRHCIGALELMEIEDFLDAIYDTMIGAIKIKDIELANEVFEAAIKSNKF